MRKPFISTLAGLALAVVVLAGCKKDSESDPADSVSGTYDGTELTIYINGFVYDGRDLTDPDVKKYEIASITHDVKKVSANVITINITEIDIDTTTGAPGTPYGDSFENLALTKQNTGDYSISGQTSSGGIYVYSGSIGNGKLDIRQSYSQDLNRDGIPEKITVKYVATKQQ